MINFGDDEQPLFRHRAQCKAKEGEVLVTSMRIMFVPGDGGVIKEFAWPAVQGVKYSPANDPKGRAMALLKTTIKGDEDIIITLLGSSTANNFKELENMKIIVSKLRKAKASGTQAAPSVTPTSTGVGAKRTADGADEVDSKRRRQLLTLDRNLAKQYRDLVEVSKILTDEEFWASYSEQTQQLEEVQPGGFRKGKQNSLLADAMAKAAGGEINLTVELKQNIFAMYPEVRRAFDAEVPLKRSELEFWGIFFQSEFYNARNSAGGRGSSSEAFRDDLFARYTDQKPASTEAGKRKVDAQILHADVDLTASFGDYRPPESFDPSDMTATDSAVSAKYNRNSALVLGATATAQEGQPAAASGSSSSAVGAGAGAGSSARRGLTTTKLDELVAPVEPEYIAVRVAPSDSRTGQAEGSRAGAGAAAAEMDYAAMVEQLLKRREGAAPSAAVPAPDRGNKLFFAETTRLRKQQAVLNGLVGVSAEATVKAQSDGSAIMGLLGIGGGDGDEPGRLVDGPGAADQSINVLDESFKQVGSIKYRSYRSQMTYFEVLCVLSVLGL